MGISLTDALELKVGAFLFKVLLAFNGSPFASEELIF